MTALSANDSPRPLSSFIQARVAESSFIKPVKPFLIQQLERYADRLAELDFLLSREDIMADMAQFMKLSLIHI